MSVSGPSSLSPTGAYALLGFSASSKALSILDISKAYRFITLKWHRDHDRRIHHSHKNSSSSSKSDAGEAKPENRGDNGSKELGEAENGISSNKDATTSWEDDDPSPHRRHELKCSGSSVDDSLVYSCRRSSLSRSASRRSHTPTPSSSSRTASRRSNSVADFLSNGFESLPRSASRRLGYRQPEPLEVATPPNFATRSTSSCRTSTRMSTSRMGPATAADSHEGTNTPTASSRTMSCRSTPTRTMSSTASSVRRGNSITPIVYSQTAARKKPQPIERKLGCTLEELLHGCVKKVLIVREVLSETGIIQEEETLKISVEPGWRKGTKIMFEGKGDEKPGYLPADIVFVIEEKRHPLFKRRGDDLEIEVEIPLVQALTGCTLPVPLLGGERMALCFEEIIYPGYEKAILGQGMPCAKDPGRRGELRITFFVEFPLQLSEGWRLEIRRILLSECECDHT